MLVSAVSIRCEFLRFFFPEAVLFMGLHFGLEGNGFLGLLGLFRILGLVPVGSDVDDAVAEADADAGPLAVVAVVVVIVPDAEVVEASEVSVSRLFACNGRLLCVRSTR